MPGIAAIFRRRRGIDRLKRLPSDQRGVGLVETTVAVAIAGLAAVGFLTAITVQSIATRNIDANNQAMELVRTYFEDVRNAPYSPTGYGAASPCARGVTCPFTPQAEYSMEVTWDYIDANGTPQVSNTKLQRVRVTLKRGGQEYFSNVDTYKACLTSVC